MTGEERQTPTEPLPDARPSADASDPRAVAADPSPEAPGADETGAASPDAAEDRGATDNALGDVVKQAFADYLDKSGARAQYGDHVNVDLAFLKAHGVPMVSMLFRELATRLVPQDLKLELPPRPAEPTAPELSARSAAEPAPDDGPRPVSVNLDLAGILGRLFRPPGSDKPT
jgi:hypothetical protein